LGYTTLPTGKIQVAPPNHASGQASVRGARSPKQAKCPVTDADRLGVRESNFAEPAVVPGVITEIHEQMGTFDGSRVGNALKPYPHRDRPRAADSFRARHLHAQPRS